jgi:hypothetical protein
VTPVAVKFTLVWPAERITLSGTVAAVGVPLFKLIVKSAILGVGSVTVPVDVAFSYISAGFILTVIVGLVTVAVTATVAELAPALAITTLPERLLALLVPATRTETVFVESPLVWAKVSELEKSTPLVET